MFTENFPCLRRSGWYVIAKGRTVSSLVDLTLYDRGACLSLSVHVLGFLYCPCDILHMIVLADQLKHMDRQAWCAGK